MSSYRANQRRSYLQVTCYPIDRNSIDVCFVFFTTQLSVFVFRLVSERTIEENILKKANQKRLLGDLAIEGGNFTTAYFKSVSLDILKK